MQRFQHASMQSIIRELLQFTLCNNIQLVSLVLETIKLHLSGAIVCYIATYCIVIYVTVFAKTVLISTTAEKV